jgi:hypothetical protein
MLRSLAFGSAFCVVIATTAFAEAPRCAGDCDADGVVRVHELILMVNAFLNIDVLCAIDCPAPDPCLGVDANGDGRITVNELTSTASRMVEAVGNCMRNCQ